MDVDGDGLYSDKERIQLKKEMGLDAHNTAQDKQVAHPPRDTARNLQDSLHRTGSPMMTSMQMIISSSLDGYSASTLASDGVLDDPIACTMPAVCFETLFAAGTGDKLSVQDLYLRFAHQLWTCGDCCEWIRSGLIALCVV